MVVPVSELEAWLTKTFEKLKLSMLSSSLQELEIEPIARLACTQARLLVLLLNTGHHQIYTSLLCDKINVYRTIGGRLIASKQTSHRNQG